MERISLKINHQVVKRSLQQIMAVASLCANELTKLTLIVSISLFGVFFWAWLDTGVTENLRPADSTGWVENNNLFEYDAVEANFNLALNVFIILIVFRHCWIFLKSLIFSNLFKRVQEQQCCTVLLLQQP